MSSESTNPEPKVYENEGDVVTITHTIVDGSTVDFTVSLQVADKPPASRGFSILTSRSPKAHETQLYTVVGDAEPAELVKAVTYRTLQQYGFPTYTDGTPQIVYADFVSICAFLDDDVLFPLGIEAGWPQDTALPVYLSFTNGY